MQPHPGMGVVHHQLLPALHAGDVDLDPQLLVQLARQRSFHRFTDFRDRCRLGFAQENGFPALAIGGGTG